MPKMSAKKIDEINANARKIIEQRITTAVPPPTGRRTNPDSFINQIASLDLHETASRALRIPAEETSWDNITQAHQKVAQSLHNQMARAKAKAPGTDFTSSRGDFRNPAGDVFVVATVTRIK